MAAEISSIISTTNPYYTTFGSVSDLDAADNPGEWCYSRVVAAIGYTDGDTISVTSGDGEYRVNSGNWTGEDGTFNNGDFLFARAPIPTDIDISSTTTFTVGSGSDTFIGTTGEYTGGNFDHYTDEENYTDGENYVD